MTQLMLLLRPKFLLQFSSFWMFTILQKTSNILNTCRLTLASSAICLAIELEFDAIRIKASFSLSVIIEIFQYIRYYFTTSVNCFNHFCHRMIFFINTHLTGRISHECYAFDSSRTTEVSKYSNLFDPVCLEATGSIYIFVFVFMENFVSR